MSRKGTSMSASLVTGCSGLFMMARDLCKVLLFMYRARPLKQEHQTLTLGLEPTYHTLYLPMHIHTYTCPSNPKVGKCTR